jgi:hypothetical protein
MIDEFVKKKLKSSCNSNFISTTANNIKILFNYVIFVIRHQPVTEIRRIIALPTEINIVEAMRLLKDNNRGYTFPYLLPFYFLPFL